MRLRALALVYALTGCACRCLAAMHSAACGLHTRVWIACTNENLRTLRVRRPAERTRWN